jgi:hypothetical protein
LFIKGSNFLSEIKNNDEITLKHQKILDQLERLKDKFEKSKKGFISHLLPFIIVNGFLFIFNIMVSPGYLWFLYPLGGWGIGLISHLFVAIIDKKHLKEIERVPSDITEEQFSLIKKIYKSEEGIYGHAASFVSTNVFLFMIYAINMFGGFPWFLFPLLGWGFGFLMHIVTAVPELFGMKKKLKLSGFSFLKDPVLSFLTNQNKPVSQEKEVNSVMNIKNADNKKIYFQALSLKDSLLRKIEKNQLIKQKIGSDIEKNIVNCIDHIGELLIRDDEIIQILDNITEEDIDKRLIELKRKYEETIHENLKSEYKKSIENYERHKKSCIELLNQKEMITLRISSAMMSLKQLEIDITNMKEITSVDNTSLRIFEEQSEDLNKYVYNLKESYQTLKRELD